MEWERSARAPMRAMSRLCWSTSLRGPPCWPASWRDQARYFSRQALRITMAANAGGSLMRLIIPCQLFGCILVSFATLGVAQSDRKLPTVTVQQPPTGGIDTVMAYAGTWKVNGERFATAHSDAGKEDTTLRNDCWKSGGYVA